MPYPPSPLLDKESSSLGTDPGKSLRGPEENLTMIQFLTVSWMNPIISLGRCGRLDESYVWQQPVLGLECSRVCEKFKEFRGSVLSRLCQSNAVDLVVIGMLAMFELACEAMLPLLLKEILRSMDTSPSRKGVILTYAPITLGVQFANTQMEIIHAWYGWRCYERSRCVCTMMIFGKALSRKSTIGSTARQPVANLSGQPQRVSIPTEWSRFGRIFGRHLLAEDRKPHRVTTPGKILNPFRGDAYAISQRFWEFDQLLKAPIGIVIAAALVWQLLGPACYLGILSLVVSQVGSALLIRTLVQYERQRKLATDEQLQQSSPFLESIRHLRWYNWQNHWLEQVQSARSKELFARLKFALLQATNRFINVLSSSLLPVLAFFAYTKFAHRPLTVDLMDEATASLDAESGSRVQEILKREWQGITRITIAHRVEAVKDADFEIFFALLRVRSRALLHGDSARLGLCIWHALKNTSEGQGVGFPARAIDDRRLHDVFCPALPRLWSVVGFSRW
ncbi:putative ABC transporter [Pseudocercospora fijiensis CIRAD86]|uniref:Putative ABC transporter n=1 Tax=Pseudocercospora fijiensis (strain CIRAD86) TaxID=383855 RepID=M3AM80_PSEFD|nr:putative ABC transporter [Pseudocercospora fijiensis CIRAD86]EME78228.1 putative ABC transporter [Pseudocercospora fijiensis CIRAD86]